MDAKKQLLILTSENLLLNPKHREKWGAKVDSITESLHIIQDGLKHVKPNVGEQRVKVGPFEDELPDIGRFSSCVMDKSDVNSLQLNVKLFLRTYDTGLAEEAISHVVESLGTNSIDNLYVTIPAEGIQHIGISARPEDESTPITSEGEDVDGSLQNLETSLNLIKLDPEREKYANDLASLWNTLSKMSCVDALGLCDVETDVFKRIYQQAEKKPSKVQVNLSSCCVVPPELRQFAQSKNIKLSTHSDSPDILGDEFCSKVASFQGERAWKPLWIVRFQIFKKQQGVLVDKRYVIALQR